MRSWRALAIVAVAWTGLRGCGDDAGHRAQHDASSDGNGAGDGNDGNNGSGDGGGGGKHDAAAPAMGCDPTQVAADCPASFVADTLNMGENGFTMTYMTDPTAPYYRYETTDTGAINPNDRVFTVTCAVGSDGTRQWSPHFSDSCFSTNDIGNFTSDHTYVDFQQLASRCPSGTYLATSSYDGNPSGGDTTCEQDGSNAELIAPPPT